LLNSSYNTENTPLACLAHKHRIIDYFRYADDIFLIFDPNHSDIQSILTDFSALHPNLHFTAETERNNTINYLHISIHKTPHELKASTCRKPTFTDSIIPHTSNHPTQHKYVYAAVRFIYNRLNSYDLQEQEYKPELNVIHNILHNNSFPITPQKQPPSNTTQQPAQTSRNKWATFSYIGKETLYITSVFKHTGLKIAFRKNNTTENLLKQRDLIPDKFSSSGVYKLTDCHKAYVGQTERQFYTHYKEHRSAFYHNGRTSNFAQLLQDNAHSFGPIDNVMQVLHHQKKGTHLNTIERFHIHIEHTAGNHLNNDHTIFPNRIFDTLIKPSTPLLTP